MWQRQAAPRGSRGAGLWASVRPELMALLALGVATSEVEFFHILPYAISFLYFSILVLARLKVLLKVFEDNAFRFSFPLKT